MASRAPGGSSNEDNARVLTLLSKTVRLKWHRLETNERRAIQRTLDELYRVHQMSTTEIARKIGRSNYFVWSLCQKAGVRLRSPDDGKALSGPKRVLTLRRCFEGPETFKGYLQGFAEGDLDVRQASTNAIMASSTTTHPAFSRCFQNLFQKYGPVYHYPVSDGNIRCKWKVAARLDNSFSFLLPNSRRGYPRTADGRGRFYSWLAGVVDADGSISILPSGEYVKLTIALANESEPLLGHIKRELQLIGRHPTGPYLTAKEGSSTEKWRIKYRKKMWVLCLQRSHEIKSVLQNLPLRHEEKIARKRLALEVEAGSRWTEVEQRIRTLQAEISRDVAAYVEEARNRLQKRGLGQAT